MTKCHLFPIVLRHQGLGFIMPAEKVTMAVVAFFHLSAALISKLI
jgi:hypothetical protein